MHQQNCSGGHDEIWKSYAETVFRGKKLIWNKKQKDIRMEGFMDNIRKKFGITIDNYWDLHRWSIENCGTFWEEIFKYFDIIHSESYEQVLPDYTELVGIDWFRGLKFNYAENVLRYRDERVALICLDEEGRERIITYAEAYEEVKKYAAAWRRHGLQKGDKVACYMPNREETIFAMLACASIGAIWGGIVVLYGPKAASSALRVMNPRFFFTVDRYCENQEEINVLENLENIVNDITSIEKVIIVPTKEETLMMDISGIRHSCFLNEFLQLGKHQQDICGSEFKFEQLPFNQPLFINFTSGTTGIPKGVVHSAGTLLAVMRDFGLHFDCKRDDVILSTSKCGWIGWRVCGAILALGSTLLLYCGKPFYLSSTPFWDLLAKYKATVATVVTFAFDKMEKLNIVPSSSCDLMNLRMVTSGASLVKFNNFEFLQEKVKQDMFIGARYGQTETASWLSGFHLNSSAYSGETQAIALGVDLRVFDDSGKSVVGQAGRMVICKPYPNFPLYLLNDESGEILRTTYLSEFPGCFSLGDEGWIDPETNGFVVLGRSDYSFNPTGERFRPDDIYWAIQDVKEVHDSLCVCQTSCKGHQRVVLFLKLSHGVEFNDDFVQKMRKKIKHELTEQQVPQIILEIKDIPRNVNGKKMERLVSQIINSNQIPEAISCRNPECLQFYCNVPQLQGSYFRE